MKRLENEFRQNNPRMYSSVQDMIRGKSESQLKEMAMNIASERGIDLQSFARQFGIRL